WHPWPSPREAYWSGDFAFTADYLARGRETMSPKNTRDMNLPPDLLFFTRITFGLNAISQQLGSRGNFHKAARRHFYRDLECPSPLGLVGIRVPDRFHRLPPLSAPGDLVARADAALAA